MPTVRRADDGHEVIESRVCTVADPFEIFPRFVALPTQRWLNGVNVAVVSALLRSVFSSRSLGIGG